MIGYGKRRQQVTGKFDEYFIFYENILDKSN